MKKILLILAITLFSTMIAKSQEQITDNNAQTYYGYVVESTPEYLRIVDEFNSEIKIAASKIKSRQKLFCSIILNNGKQYTANLGATESTRLYFYTKEGKEIVLTKLEFAAIIFHDRKLTSGNWRPLSYNSLILED